MKEEHNEFKKCPFCAEEIRFEAIKCKHCGEMLAATEDGNIKQTEEPIQEPTENAVPASILTKKFSTWGCFTGCLTYFLYFYIFFAGLILVGKIMFPNDAIKRNQSSNSTVSSNTESNVSPNYVFDRFVREVKDIDPRAKFIGDINMKWPSFHITMNASFFNESSHNQMQLMQMISKLLSGISKGNAYAHFYDQAGNRL